MKDKRSGGKIIGIILAAIVFLLLFFVAALLTWTLGYWHDITFDEIVFYLNSHLEGTAGNVINAFIFKVAVPSVVAFIIFVVLSALLKKKNKDKARKIITFALIAVAAAVSGIQLYRADKRYGIVKYIRSQNSKSDFVDTYYVAPTKDNVKFPEKKRNLVYIYLESMETTFTDKTHGGDFDEDVIPELRELALNGGETFEGNNERLNGGHVITGATYTMSGMVAQSAGIPIAGGKTNAATSYADTFYPGIRSIGDILKDEGYNQAFMCGSPVSFGSRKTYLKSHGIDDFLDYDYAAANDLIPKGYKVWWGFEDRKLFEFAKTKVADMASSDKPFALTILTADTHFEDGYVCGLCDNKFDSQYSNVMACSSRQVSEFVRWLQKQDFYENTTIILSGDHITMDADYCNGVDKEYQRRTYTNIINAPVKPAVKRHREYTTFDMFPTTLAAMGAKIDGNRLGLGTDLFSDSPTLYERFGRDTLEEELTKDSQFFRDIASFDPLAKSIVLNLNYLEMDCIYKDGGTIEVGFWGLERAGLVIETVKGEYYNAAGKSAGSCDFTLGGDKTWRGTFNTGLTFRDAFAGTMKLTATDSKGEEHVFYENTDGRSNLRYSDFASYIKAMSELDNVSILIASKGYISNSLLKKQSESLRLTGLECKILENGEGSYCAAVGTGFKKEKTSEGMCVLNGTFKDGTEYEIASSVDLGSVVIGKKEYSPDKKGFNVVVYDERNGKVIDRSSFALSSDSAYELNEDNIDIGIRYNKDQKNIDLWITGNAPEVLLSRQLHVYMFTWDKDHPKELRRTVLSQGKFMTYKAGSTVPYYFAKELDVSGYDPSSFGMMLIFTDDTDGTAVFSTKSMTDLCRDEYKDPQIPSSVTFREE